MTDRPCDACGKRPGRVHFVEIRGTDVAQSLLCETCAQEKSGAPPISAPPPGFFPPGFQPPPGFPIPSSGPAAPLPAFDWGAVLAGAVAPSGPVPCRTCGHTWENFRKVGRLGCPACYDHFRTLVAQLLARIAREARHRGLRPPGFSAAPPPPVSEPAPLRPAPADLRARLAEAVAREDFEEAARIRDELRTRSGS